MTFTQAEQYLLSLHNLPRNEYMKNPRLCGQYLERTKFFLKLLGSPEKKIPHYIHITGTSGKGSVATFLHGMLSAAGKKTGLLTSPHASRITERWHINGREMTKSAFTHMVEDIIQPALDRYTAIGPFDMPSFHEMTDIMGFYHFADNSVEWAVLEVGMGGRNCSSNVIPHKDAAIITNIGWDHVQLLGPTKKKIAEEKAGVITARCDVFTMEKRKTLRDIFLAEARRHHATLHAIAPDVPYTLIKADMTGSHFVYQGQKFFVSAPGLHQIKNAILCIEVARHIGLPDQAIQTGLARTHQRLCMEVVARQPMIILDGAHNEDKIKTTVAATRDLTIGMSRTQKIYLMIGLCLDKNLDSIVKELNGLRFAGIFCTRNTVNPYRKVVNPKKIADAFRRYRAQTPIFISLDPQRTLREAKKRLTKNDILLVTGSIFLSGELRPLLTKR